MSKKANEVELSNAKSKKLKKERSVDEATPKTVNKIIEQIRECLEDPVENKDSTDGLGDTFNEVFQPILDEFQDLIEENKDKKYFISGVIKISIILLSSAGTTLTKI